MLRAYIQSAGGAQILSSLKSKPIFYTEKAFFDYKKVKMKEVVTIILKFFNMGKFYIFIWYSYFPLANKNKAL